MTTEELIDLDRYDMYDYLSESIDCTDTGSVMRFLQELLYDPERDERQINQYSYSEFGSCYFTIRGGYKVRIANHQSNNNRDWDIEIILGDDDPAENIVQQLYDNNSQLIY